MFLSLSCGWQSNHTIDVLSTKLQAAVSVANVDRNEYGAKAAATADEDLCSRHDLCANEALVSIWRTERGFCHGCGPYYVCDCQKHSPLAGGMVGGKVNHLVH